MTLAEIAAETRTEDRDEWARAVWERIRIEEPEEAFALVGYVIRDELRRLERIPVRQLEQIESAVPLHLQGDLMKSRAWVPDVGLVPWGEMTAEQHRSMAAYWLDEAATLTDGANRHLRAAEMIEATGVSCLNDIPERAKAKSQAKPKPRSPKSARVPVPA